MKAFAVLSILLTVHSACGQLFPACQPYYTVAVDTQVTGVTQVGITTEAACKTNCDADVNCIGFDIDTNAVTTAYCSLTNDPTVATAGAAGINHYTRSQACPFPFSSERCFFSYLGPRQIVATQQGPSRGTARTASDCMGGCIEAGTCKAAIYDSVAQQCYRDYTTVALASLTSKTGNQFYQITTCDTVPLDGSCTDTYIPRINFAKAGGQFVTNNNTQSDCESTCSGTATCLGYDFDRGAVVCFIHSDAKQSEGVKANVDNYRKAKECTTTTDTCKYKEFLGYIPGVTYVGTAVPGIISITECLAACNKLGDTCVGVIFNIDFNYGCETYIKATATTTPTVTQNMNAFTDMANLRLSTSGQVGYGRDSCATTTTVAPTTAPGTCVEMYRTMTNKKLQGGSGVVANPATVLGCQTTCTANAACWGLDFNTGDNSCWLFYDNTVTPYTPPIDSIIGTESHYEKYRKCGDCEYNIFNGKSTSLRIAKITFTTLETCLDGCSLDTSCKGVDFDTNKCYFHTTATTAATRTDNGASKLYEKKVCGGTAVGGCDFNRFVQYAGKKISGGSPVATSPKTSANCEVACISNSACYAFDLDSSVTCWLLTTFGNVVDGATGENHNQREPKCTFGTKTDCQYMHTGKFEPSNTAAKTSTTVKTKELCFESCTDANVCSGLTWISNTQMCTLYSTLVTWDVTSLKDSTNSLLEGYKFTGCTSTGTTVPTTTIAVISTTTGTGGCVGGTWQEFTDMHASGGIQKSQFTTRDTCRQGCIDTVDCVGVDVDMSGGPVCWFHLSQAAIDGRTSQTGTTLYALTRCADVTTPPASVCTSAYIKEMNKKQSGGVPVPAVNTLIGCQDDCMSKVTCVSFDYQTVLNQCYSHTALGTVVDTGTEPVDHYRKNWECQGCNYVNYPNQRFTNGDPMSPYTTLDACLNACAGHATCVAIDFRMTPQMCDFYYTSVTSQLIAATGIQHWANGGGKPCSGTTGTGGTTVSSGTTTISPTTACVDDYKLMSAKKRFSGVRVTAAGANSVAGCKTFCNGQPTCAGFDYSPSQNACWSHTSNTGLVDSNDGADHYSKMTTCGECSYDVYVSSKVNNVIGTSSTVTSKAACIQLCNAEGTCKSVDYDDTAKTCVLYASDYTNMLTTSTTVEHYEQSSCPCAAVMQYEVATDSKVNQGQRISAATTLVTCTDDCDKDTKCVGFDFNQRNECWKTITSNTNPVIPSSEGVNHYTKYATCGGCRYDIMGNMAAPKTSGTLQPSSVNTWKACVSTCTTNTNCQSLDFYSDTNACYHFTSSFTTGLTANTVSIHYVKKSCDQGITPTSGGSTESTTPGGSTSTPVSCPIKYVVFPNEKVIGLTKVSNIATLEACLQNCQNDAACVGFDYNKKAGATDPCWKQTDNTKTRSPSNPNVEDVLHYSVTRGCSGCGFTPYSNSRPSTFAVEQAYTNEEQCVAGCATSTTCMSSSYQNNQCLHSTDILRTTASNSRTWEKSTNCTGSETTVTSTATTTTATTTATQAPTEGTCKETYILYPAKHVSDGTRQSPNTNNATCAAACDAATNCVGYDLNPTNNACWLTTSRQAQKNPLQSDNEVNHYSKVVNCEGTCYRQIHDATFGTSSSFGEGSKDSCLLTCKSKADCRDVIYNPTLSSGRCRLVSTNTPATIASLTESIGTTFYSRLANCAQDAAKAP